MGACVCDGRGLCGRDLRCLPVGASGPVRPCGATLPTAWAPSAREAADGYTVPKAPAGYALINVIDIVSRNIGQLQWKNLCSCQSYAYTSGLYTIRFRENVLFRTKCIFRRVLYHSTVLYGTKQHTSKEVLLKRQQFVLTSGNVRK